MAVWQGEQKIRDLEDLERVVASAERPVILIEGTRKLPASDVELLRRTAARLARCLPSAVFRTGNAEGSDTAFAAGVSDVDAARLEYVLPTQGMGRRRRHGEAGAVSLEALPRAAEEAVARATCDASPAAERLIDAHLGRVHNRRLAAKGRYLLRDTLKVAGCPEAGVPPATVGVFYVNESDPLGGGTGHTIRVCAREGIPVVMQHVWRRWVAA
jgi:hypothetical protein